MNKYKIVIKHISLDKNQSVILNDINLELNPQSKSVIAGKSGSGKTSLLRLINRLEEPTEGSIHYDGINIFDINVLELRKKITLVPQIPIVLDYTVQDNLTVQSKLGIAPYPATSTMIQTLELCELSEDFLHKNAEDLSVGEKQRVCIARSIINSPDVLLLDEPTSSLDKGNSVSILQLINNLNKELGITIILVTHKIEESKFLNGDFYTLSDGHIHRGLIN